MSTIDTFKSLKSGAGSLTTKGAASAFSFADEFRRFALKGNVIDLAVGVIIGAAFGKLVDSLVKNILMPLLSLAMPSEQSYLTWKVAFGAKEIPYGLFIGDIVNFIIVAFAVFIFVVKFIGFVTRRRNEAVVVADPTAEERLLGEIRDLLKAKV